MNTYIMPAFHSRILRDRAFHKVKTDTNRSDYNASVQPIKASPGDCRTTGYFFSAKKGCLIKITLVSETYQDPTNISRGIDTDHLMVGELKQYGEQHKLLLVDNFEDARTVHFLEQNKKKLKRLKLIPVVKDKDSPVLEDRIKSFLPVGDPLLIKINCQINPEDLARAGYFRNSEFLQCCNCLYRTQVTDVNRLLQQNKKYTAPYDSKVVMSTIEHDHKNKCDIYNNTILSDKQALSKYYPITCCNRISRNETTFISLLDENEKTKTEVQHYKVLIFNKDSKTVIQPGRSYITITTQPDLQIIKFSDLTFEFSTLTDKFQLMRTDLMTTVSKNQDVSTIHSISHSIVKDVQKIKLIESIEPFIHKLFTKIEKVRSQVPSSLDSFTKLAACDDPNEMAQINHPDAEPESIAILKLLQMQACALPEDQEGIRQLLQVLLTEIKALPKAAAEDGLALLFFPQGEGNPLKYIFPRIPLKDAQVRSAQIHTYMEQTESFLSTLTESVLQPIRFILGDGYFYLHKAIREKIFLETPEGGKDLT